MLKKIAVGLVLVLSVNLVRPALAQDSTPSGDIKQKIKKLQDEIASKASQFQKEITQKLQNRAYAGSIQSKSATSLTMATDSGPKIITLNQDTIYSSKNGKFSPKTLAEQDYIIALGDIDDNGVLTAKKVIKSLPLDKRQIISGTIYSINPTQITITSGKQNTNISLTSTTYKNLKVGQLVSVVVTDSSDPSASKPEARFIQAIINPEVTPNREASSSATGSAIKK